MKKSKQTGFEPTSSNQQSIVQNQIDWQRFCQSGKIADYLTYRRHIEGAEQNVNDDTRRGY